MSPVTPLDTLKLQLGPLRGPTSSAGRSPAELLGQDPDEPLTLRATNAGLDERRGTSLAQLLALLGLGQPDAILALKATGHTVTRASPLDA